MTAPRAAEILLLAAWAGAAWFAALVAAPQLFGMLPPEQAGNVAGMMFRSVFWISLPALGWCLVRVARSPASTTRLDMSLVVGALGVSLVLGLFLQPYVAAMRVGAAPPGSGFAIAHGAASALFLVNCMLAAVILLRRWQAR